MITFKIDLDGYCTEISDKALDFFGYTTSDAILSRDLHAKIHHTNEAGQVHDFQNCDLFHALKFKHSYSVSHVRFWKSDGAAFYADVHIDPIVHSGTLVGAVISLAVQADTSIAPKQNLRRLAFYDSLTGLPNRETLFSKATRVLQYARQNSTYCAVLFLDLDQFKAVNDMYGHTTGDALLQSVGCRLQSCVRRTDLVSRIGGDEFVILLSSLKTTQEAELVAKKVLRIFEEPFCFGNVVLNVGVSIGISVTTFASDSLTLQEMINEADAAMYTSKRAGKNQFCRFSSSMGRSLERHLTIERELREELLAPSTLQLVFQPVFCAKSQKLVGVESLVRWKSKTYGEVTPAEFLAVAENSGLMLQIDDWVLSQVCQQIAVWSTTPLASIWVSVNIAAAQLQSASFTKVLARHLQTTPINTSKLIFEVSGATLLLSTDMLKRNLQFIKQSDISITIDNFGIGLISLQQLRDLPISTLKVDPKFLREAVVPDSDTTRKSIFEILTILSSLLQFSTLITGIETEDELCLAKSTACQYLQGYLLAKPVSASQLLSTADVLLNPCIERS